MLISSYSYAERISNESVVDSCTAIENMAETIMDRRQSGVKMSILMDIAKESKDKSLSRIITSLIIEAYEKPRYNTEKHKRRVIEDFRNNAFLNCYKDIVIDK